MVNNTCGYQKYMERIFTIREFELDHFVQEHMDFVDPFQRSSPLAIAREAWSPRSTTTHLGRQAHWTHHLRLCLHLQLLQ